MTQAVLPIMRKQKSGLIVNISSIGGRAGFPAVSAYVSVLLHDSLFPNTFS